jgi:ADP-ribosylglycohydrolase
VVLGAATGDAMGQPTEFINSFAGIFSKYGLQRITCFELFWTREGKCVAPYTDDTQMAEVVLRALMESRKTMLNIDTAMNLVANGFAAWANSPQGTRQSLPGRLPGSSGRCSMVGGWCGSVMRAYPFGIIFHDDTDKAERWDEDGAEHGTHEAFNVAGSTFNDQKTSPTRLVAISISEP